MLLSFERGNASEPKGHALVYLKSTASAEEVHATYLVVPPIAIDLMKYMPPMFAGKISPMDMQSLSAIPLPPMPEKVASLPYLRRLAEQRDDDLLFLGALNPDDVTSVMVRVGEAAQEYFRTCSAAFSAIEATAAEQPKTPEALGSSVEDVVFGLMGERDKLEEVAKLVGKLRYAMEGRDRHLEADTAAEMEALGRHLPEKYRLADLIKAARVAGDKGRQLAELHVTRCFKLCDEDYRAVEEIDQRIRELETRA